MKTFISVLISILFLNTLYAASSQDDIKVAIVGKLSKFIKWQKNQNQNNFIISVYGDEPFRELLFEKYRGRTINTKNVLVTSISSLEDIQQPDILYIGNIGHDEQYSFIDHAKKNSILSISQEKGFAQRGGIVQLYFVSEKLKLKINHEASLESNLKINAALLSISTIVKGEM